MDSRTPLVSRCGLYRQSDQWFSKNSALLSKAQNTS